jgi:hypothetical protein
MGFDFGSLTVKGQQIDWSQLQKYDKDGNGKIDSSEYSQMVKDLDPDGFNGVAAFGNVDANHDGKITEDEMKLAEQKAEITQYADNYLENAANSNNGKADINAQNLITALVNKYMAMSTSTSASLLTDFEAEFNTEMQKYQDTSAKIDAAKTTDNSVLKNLKDVVKKADNGYISTEETGEIRSAAGAEALKEALNGDYTLLKGLGCADATIAAIKAKVAALSNTADLAKAYQDLQTSINTLIKNTTAQKLVSATKAINTDAGKAEYTLNAEDIDYTGIDMTASYSGRNTEGPEEDVISQLKPKLIAQIKKQCEADGKDFNEALIDSIFEGCKKDAMNDSTYQTQSAGLFRHSKHGFKTKDLCDNVVKEFNNKIAEYYKDLGNSAIDKNGVANTTNITTNMLATSSADLTVTDSDTDAQKAEKTKKAKLKALQQELFADKNATDKMSSMKEDLTLFADNIKSVMKNTLGSKYNETAMNNICDEAVTEICADDFKSGIFGMTIKFNIGDEVTKLQALIAKKVADYNASKSISA